MLGPAGRAHAASYNPGGKPHPETDMLFRGERVLELSITVDHDGLQILRSNTSNRYNSPDRPDALATVREGTNVWREVAIHLKGSAGSFRGLEGKPAFTLHFDEHIAGQRFHGLEKISLNNSVQDSTYMCEFLGRQMFNAAGVPAPRAGHATVTFNGEPLGLYVLLEGWNKQFLKRHFADVSGNFYEGAFRNDITAELEAKSGAHPEDRSDLAALIRATRQTDLNRRFTALEQVLDLERFATFVALEVLTSHWDGYSLHVNNYRIFHDNRTDRLVFMPHGLDQLFGVRRREVGPQLMPSMSGMAAAALLETRAGRRLYLDRLADLQTNVFDAPALLAAVDRLETLLRPALQDDSAGRAEFDRRVPLLRDRLEERAEQMRDQFAALHGARFDARGEASLAEVNFRNTLSFNQGRFRRGENAFPGANNRSYGGFRALLMLEAGRYRFEGRVRSEVNKHEVDAEAVRLRSSEGREFVRSKPRNGWATVGHEFTLAERDYVELSYDLAADYGFSAFDRGSLKLVRLNQ